MAAAEQTTTTTFRFKFSSEFLTSLKNFSAQHKYDDPKDFKDSWDIWVETNKEDITREHSHLKGMGYNGDMSDKMYKSVRYYFKNKSSEKTKPKKRRQYVGLNRDLLDEIDEHIEAIFKFNHKPAVAFKEFIENNEYKHLVDNEMVRLKNQDFTREDIQTKLKKTYKNRYFIKKKNN